MSSSANATEVAVQYQWNDLFTMVGSKPIYGGFMRAFAESARDRPVRRAYRTFGASDVTGYVYPARGKYAKGDRVKKELTPDHLPRRPRPDRRQRPDPDPDRPGRDHQRPRHRDRQDPAHQVGERLQHPDRLRTHGEPGPRHPAPHLTRAGADPADRQRLGRGRRLRPLPALQGDDRERLVPQGPQSRGSPGRARRTGPAWRRSATSRGSGSVVAEPRACTPGGSTTCSSTHLLRRRRTTLRLARARGVDPYALIKEEMGLPAKQIGPKR